MAAPQAGRETGEKHKTPFTAMVSSLEIFWDEIYTRRRPELDEGRVRLRQKLTVQHDHYCRLQRDATGPESRKPR